MSKLLEQYRLNHRRYTLLAIILLAGISNMPFYAVQGALLTGHTVNDWPSIFWVVEWFLWGFRSLIEMVTIYYMLVTRTSTNKQFWVMAIWEGFAILLILFTLGSVAVSLDDKSLQMVEQLNFWWSFAVKFGIVSYLPIIIGGAAVAYKIQPDIEPVDTPYTKALEQGMANLEQEAEGAQIELRRVLAQYDELSTEVGDLVEQSKVDAREIATLKSEAATRLDAMKLLVNGIPITQKMSKKNTIAAMYVLWNGSTPEVEDIADMFGVSKPTVLTARALADNIKESLTI